MIAACLVLLPAGGCSSRPSPAEADRRPRQATGVDAHLDGAGGRPADRGRSIYLTGTSPAGRPIRAQLSGGGADVPAAVLTCGNCHGRDGIGKAEGGIVPATITWDELTQEYGPTHPSGRRRAAYDERSVRNAITMGRDPSGRVLDAAMPRYMLAREDLDDLVAYLKELGRDADPGITDRAVVVGTILAPASSLGAMNRAVKAVLSAYFRDVDDRGGIYDRRIELRSIEAPESAEARGDAIRRFLERPEIFAVVAPFIAGAEGELDVAAREGKVPVLGPFSLRPGSGSPLNRYVFYLHSGLADQARALAMFATDRLAGRKPTAIVWYSESDPASRGAAEEVLAECQRLGWGPVALRPVARVPETPESRDSSVMKAADAIFVLAPEGQESDERSTVAAGQGRSLVLIPGGIARMATFEKRSGIRDRLFFSFPTLPVDTTAEGRAEYERLAATYHLPAEHRSSQTEALAAAKIFVDAMVAAGRGVRRERLIEELERFYQKPNGLTRPVTFGPNRRSGTRGAYILGFDSTGSQLVPVSGFIEITSE